MGVCLFLSFLYTHFSYYSLCIKSLHLQKSIQKGIRENEFLLAKGEFDMDELFIHVDNDALSEFLVEDFASCVQCVQEFLQIVLCLRRLRWKCRRSKSCR